MWISANSDGEGQCSRYGLAVWFPSLREKQLLLEPPEAAGLRTRQSRYLENGMKYLKYRKYE